MSWEKVKLGEVTESCLGKMLDQKKNKGSYKPYLANVNVRWGFFDLDNLQEMRFEDDEDERYGIKYGDLIICEGGEPGRCAICIESVFTILWISDLYITGFYWQVNREH